MKKKTYAVIGHPIGHTMSPFIHSRLFELAGIDAEYSVLDIAPEALGTQFKERLKNLDGFNITIPHKQRIIGYLDGLDKKAGLYGSVNTVKNGEQSIGYTTDPDGFLKALEAAQIPLKGRVVILGTGGVARTMAYEAAKAGCNLTIAVRPDDLPAVACLAGELSINVFNAHVDTCVFDRIEDGIDLLINATPVGMYPNTGACPVGDEIIKSSKYIFDAVYNPLDTQLLKKAEAFGVKALGGISMLVWQAVVSHEIWNGSVYDSKDIEQLCRDSAQELMRTFHN